MSNAGEIATKIGLNFLEQAVEHIPELIGVIQRGLADEPNRALVDQVRERLPQKSESEQAADELRAKQQGG